MGPAWTVARASWFALLSACTYQTAEATVPAAATEAFVQDVYPLLLADCGFPACHGDDARFFAIYGPGRTRLTPDTDPFEPPTAEELAFSYTRARSMLISPDGVRRAPLLRKPLAVSAGGAGHAADDAWGGAVYETKRDPRYETLFFWALGEAP